MTLFDKWFDTKTENNKDATLWLLKENHGQRSLKENQFWKTVRSHYDDLDQISADIATLGFIHAAAILKERLPQSKKARSGELGEIMATEFAEEKLEFQIPVRRLRYKDGRDMALRGDDFIGIKKGKTEKDIVLLKGESKSNAKLGKNTIEEARFVLNRDAGRCTPISLLFVADRLLEKGGSSKALGLMLRSEVALKSIKPANIHHAFFSLTGNDAEDLLREDLSTSDVSRSQNVINIMIDDHQDFIRETFEKVSALGVE